MTKTQTIQTIRTGSDTGFTSTFTQDFHIRHGRHADGTFAAYVYPRGSAIHLRVFRSRVSEQRAFDRAYSWLKAN